jgi:hypothetical protein
MIMRLLPSTPRSASAGYALMLTLLFISVTLLVLAGLGHWTFTESAVTARNNAFNGSVAAAEGATEVVIARMDQDFLHQTLSTSVAGYSGILPGTLVTNGWPADYQFSDGRGNNNKTDIECVSWQQWTNLDSGFVGLHGIVNSYQITANATKLTGLYPVSAGVRQVVQFISIPIFQFAIFYAMDLEINPGAPMIVTGKTHGNADIYLAPGSSLTFQDTVSYVGSVYLHRDAGDPTGGTSTTPVFNGAPQEEQVSAMTLPVGTDNNPTNVVQILDMPPAGESPQSPVGSQRLYNHADLVILATNDSVTVQFNNYEDGTGYTLVPTNAVGSGSTGYSFVNTNLSFYDYREGKTVMGTEIDIQALTNWLASAGGYSFNVLAQSRLGHQINSIYVKDQRSGAGKLTAVRVANGRYLPSDGLTVATPCPLYVKGNFNAPDLTVGLTNTAQVKPASFLADSITVLSGQWSDTNSAATTLAQRPAANTTVNAAFLAGIVPTATDAGGQGHYSGGVENFPRFLENWNGSAMTYNGSMVVLFPSRYATNYWIAPGTYYNPPTRDWAFDMNFLQQNKLPPATPQVRTLQRGDWSVVAASGN